MCPKCAPMEETKRYTIAYRGLRSGLHDFHFKVDGGLFRAFGSTEIKDGDCDVSVALERGESMLTLDVNVDGSVVVECDRCLEDCNVPIHYEGQLLVKFSDEGHEYDGVSCWRCLTSGCIPTGSAIPTCWNVSASFPTRSSAVSKTGSRPRAATRANGPSWPRSRNRWRPTGRKQNKRNKLFPAGRRFCPGAGKYLGQEIR